MGRGAQIEVCGFWGCSLGFPACFGRRREGQDAPKRLPRCPEARPGRAKIPPRRSQDGSRLIPRRFPEGPRCAKAALRCSQESPRRPQDASRRPQDASRPSKIVKNFKVFVSFYGFPGICSKTLSRRPKASPGRSQDAPGRPQTIPRRTKTA